ncbi:Coiled-coil domain-containing protein 96, partial [Coelomomyces lativittatus]
MLDSSNTSITMEPVVVEHLDEVPPTTCTSFDRSKCISDIKTAYMNLENLRYQNSQLQTKISELFRKRRSEDKSLESDKSVMDQEKRYAVIMGQYKQILATYNDLKKVNANAEGDLRLKLKVKKVEVSEKAAELFKYRRQVAMASEHSRTGKGIPIKALEQLEALEEKKGQHVSLVRLENIKLRNKLKRHEHILHQKEELAEGLHLIDFEQLKIENQTYNEKIEERNEELLKLRKKITNIVQVLAHIKEKLEFVQVENKDLIQTLQSLDELVSKRRDALPQSKQKREALRKSNIFLKQKHGLLGNEPLLRDFEERV